MDLPPPNTAIVREVVIENRVINVAITQIIGGQPVVVQIQMIVPVAVPRKK